MLQSITDDVLNAQKKLNKTIFVTFRDSQCMNDSIQTLPRHSKKKTVLRVTWKVILLDEQYGFRFDLWPSLEHLFDSWEFEAFLCVFRERYCPLNFLL